MIGIVYAALAVVAGFGLEHTTTLKPGASAAELPSFVTTHSGLGGDVIAASVVLLVLLVFAAVLRRLVAGAGDLVASLVGWSASAAVGTMLVGLGATAGMVQLPARTSASSMEALWRTAIGAQELACFPLALLMGAAAAGIWRSGALPRGVAVASLALAGVELGAALVPFARGAGHFDAVGPLPSIAWGLILGASLLLARRTAKEG